MLIGVHISPLLKCTLERMFLNCLMNELIILIKLLHFDLWFGDIVFIDITEGGLEHAVNKLQMTASESYVYFCL